MRARRWCVALVVVTTLACALPAGADEKDSGASSHQVYADALGVLRARLEALVKKAALLERQGDFAGALKTYSEVEEVYEQVLRDLRTLAKTVGAPTEPAERLPKKDKWKKRPIAEPPAIKTNPPIGLAPPPGTFRGRGGARPARASPLGAARDRAVDEALRWLAAHQSPSGNWEAEGFGKWCDGKPNTGAKPDGQGKPAYDPGVTGLALCAFLGAGYTNRGRHPFKNVVSKGLRYLKNIQDPEGCFGSRGAPQYIYNHATAALAMVEAYGMTSSPIFKGSAQRALEFHALSRNPYFAWRYGVRPGDNDTSVSSWMLMAVRSGQLINADAAKHGNAAPLVIDEEAFEGVRSWLDKMTDAETGRVGYITRGSGPARPKELVDRFPGDKSEAMTAAGMLSRIMAGEDPRKSASIRKGAELLRALPPIWNAADGSIDMTYWYFGTMAAYQVGGKTWRTWRIAIDRAIVEQQRGDGEYCQFKGSWDPIGPWGLDGGRVYSTAMMALCCEVFYRYDRVFGTK